MPDLDATKTAGMPTPMPMSIPMPARPSASPSPPPFSSRRGRGPVAPRLLGLSLSLVLSGAAAGAAPAAPPLAADPPAAPAAPRPSASPEDAELEAAARLLPGRYDTSRQAEDDVRQARPYRHDVATFAVTRVFPKGAGPGAFFYVENALVAEPARPYRQRVYHLFRRDGGLVLEFCRLADPSRVLGGAPAALATLSASELKADAGCEVPLAKSGDAWRGATAPGACLSTWKGAATLSSEIVVSPAGVDALDRGYDASGKQVWGPTDGRGYEFRKRND